MKRLRIFPAIYYRSQKSRSRQRTGVIQKKPFQWGKLWRALYRIVRSLLLICLLGVIFVGPYYGWQYLKENNTFFKIETVSVYGDVVHLPNERMNELIKDAVGQNLIGLDMQQYQDNILEESWIKSVSLKRKWFHEIEIYLEEETPIAIWNESDMIDMEGETFTPSFVPNRTWVYLSGPEDRAKDVVVAYQRAKSMLANSGFTLKEMILDETGSWTLLLDDDLKLIMGTEDFDQRLLMFLRQFPEKDVLARIEYIDFRYKNGFSVKWKQLVD